MRTRRLHWYRVWAMIAALLVLAIGASGQFAIDAEDPGARDFVAYWSLPRSLLLGFGLYNTEWLSQVQSALDFGGWIVGGVPLEVMPLWNPPPTVPLLFPIAALDFTPAVLVWAALNVGLFGFAALHFNWVQPNSLPPQAVVLCCLGVPPLMYAAVRGQPTPLLVAAVIFAWLALRRGNAIAGGILLVPLMIKPHLFSATVVLLLISALRRRLWLAPVVTAVLLSVLTAVITVLEPDWITGWLSQGISPAISASIWDFGAAVLGLPDWIPIASLMVGIGLSLWRYRDIRDVTPTDLGEAALLSLIFSPYLWEMDLSVALPAILVFSRALWRPGWRLLLFVPSLLLNPIFVVRALGISNEPATAVIEMVGVPTMVDIERFVRVMMAVALYLFFWYRGRRLRGDLSQPILEVRPT